MINLGASPSIGCYDTPSAEWVAVNLSSASRSNFTQCGAVIPVWFTLALLALVVIRTWEATPLRGVTYTKACLEPGSSDSRIIITATEQKSWQMMRNH